MNILVIDAQGGGIGRQLVVAIKAACPDASVAAVGTNSAATSAMLKAGADKGATGENAIAVACRKADIIAGPMGIVIADSMLGEITASMAAAIGQSTAVRVLIPMNNCDSIVAGVADMPVGQLIQLAANEIGRIAGNRVK